MRGARAAIKPIEEVSLVPHDWPKGVWCPAAASMKGYPKSQEAWDRKMAAGQANREAAVKEGKMHRREVPNGWAGRRDEVAEWRRNSQTEAERLVPLLSPPNPYISLADNEAGNMAMAFLFARIIDPTYSNSERLLAARIVLPYLLPRPRLREARAVNGGALGFLTGLLGSL